MSPNANDDQAPLPERPKQSQPMSETHRTVAKIGSTILAVLVWAGIKAHLYETKGDDISSMQLRAGALGGPMVLDTPPTVRDKITEALTGKEEKDNTIIINPPGQEPAIQVVTPEATIAVDKRGEIETITPNENTMEEPITEKEAKSTVDSALKDAIKKTVPEDTTKPASPEEKE